MSTTSRRELSSSFFPPLQGKAPKEIEAILTETLACFLPGRAKDLSAPQYYYCTGLLFKPCAMAETCRSDSLFMEKWNLLVKNLLRVSVARNM